MQDDLNKAAAALGKKGGQAKSTKKAAAARENGKKGGRPRTYYALNYPCGVAVHADTGMAYAHVHAFRTQADRAQWIEQGGDFRTSADWREDVPASDELVRRMKRMEAAFGMPHIERH